MAAPTTTARPKPARRLAGALLIALMAIGSISMWLVSPILWIWIGSQLENSTQPSMGPLLVIGVGLVVTTVLMAKGLGALNRLYGRLVGRRPVVRDRLPWLRSLRGEREGGQPVSVLEVVMITSVSLAVTLVALWFFFIAGSSLPH